MHIKKYDALLQTLLVVVLVGLNSYLLFNNLSYFVLLSILLLKVYQIIGGGGMHLWGCHGLGKQELKGWHKVVIMFFWMLCGIGRASHFCKYHIIHHFYCDKPGDPHSPNDHNAITLTLGLWTLFTKKVDQYITNPIKVAINVSYVRLTENKIANWFDKWHYAIIFSVLGGSIYLSPFWGLYLVALPMLLNILDGNFFFVYYFHRKGIVRNIPWVDWWIIKSGAHKVHHRWLK